MLLKLSAKEAYGVNMAMSLCEGSDCRVTSSKIGNTEILYAVVRAGTKYTLTLDYSHSIIEISSFYDCPHSRVSLSMTELGEARKMMEWGKNQPDDYVSKQEKMPYSLNSISTSSSLV